MKGLNEWLPAWKARGWKTAAKKPVKNQDLWQALDEASRGRASHGAGCRAMRVTLATSGWTVSPTRL